MKSYGRTEEVSSCNSRICEPYNICHVEDQGENRGRDGVQIQLDYGDDQKPDPENWEGI